MSNKVHLVLWIVSLLTLFLSYFSSFFNKLIYFKIGEQLCIHAFCHTSTWVGYRYTYVPSLLIPPPSPFHPSRLSQSTNFGFLASCIKLLMVAYFTYGNVHVSMYNSSHPLLPPLCPKVFPLCLCLLCCLACGIVGTIYITCICVKIWYLSFSFWFTSFSS